MGSLACEEKLKFATHKEANGAAVVALHNHGTKLKAYKCRDCGWWHLASNYGD